LASRDSSKAITRYCVVSASAALVLAAALAFRGPLPALIPLVTLGGLFVFAENISVELPSGASISASFVMIMASVVVFRTSDSRLGPVAVGMLGGLYLPHLRALEWRKVAMNVGGFGLATFVTSSFYWALPRSVLNDIPLLVASSIGAAVVFFATNVFFVGVYYSLVTHHRVRDVLRDLAPGHFQVYPFALLGVFLGRLYLTIGPTIVPLFVVPILIARQTFASYLELKASQEAMVRTLIKALEAKDPYTSGHAERVAVYAQYMGEEMSFGPRRMERLRLAALMHDIGKLVVPNHILNKPGRLTEEEFARVRQHEHVSVEVLRRIDFLAPVAPSASGDFSHYQPDAKKTPIEPYIVHTADAYDAMTSTRSYRKALTQDVAFEELRKNAGKQFHPETVTALTHAIEKRDEHHGAGYERDVHDWVVAPPEAGVGSAGLGDFAPEEPKQRKRTAP